MLCFRIGSLSDFFFSFASSAKVIESTAFICRAASFGYTFRNKLQWEWGKQRLWNMMTHTWASNSPKTSSITMQAIKARSLMLSTWVQRSSRSVTCRPGGSQSLISFLCGFYMFVKHVTMSGVTANCNDIMHVWTPIPISSDVGRRWKAKTSCSYSINLVFNVSKVLH